MHEASLYGVRNSFVTLTYDGEHVPLSLEYRDFQLFMKRLRSRLRQRVRFYMCGEYGEEGLRPHFHALLFGVAFPDRYYWMKGDGGADLYRSELLEELWPAGFSTVGDVTFESAAYVSRYIVKKITGDLAKEHYRRVDPATGEVVQAAPEFNHMSLKPGIGARWLEKFHSDVYPEGKVVVNGREVRPPKYYDRRAAGIYGAELEELELRRHREAQAAFADNSDERLQVKEKVARARLAFKKRSIS